MDTITSTGLFRLSTEVRFGDGVANEIADWVTALGSRALIVTDRGVQAVGLIEPLALLLTDAGIAVEVIDAISPNPRDAECQAVAERALALGANVMVAIGGGSPIDAAKCAAALATNGGSARDWASPRTLEHAPLPIIAIPTTAGTGSEVTRGAVITDTERKVKLTVKDSRLAPNVALVDPLLTLSVPSRVTAATGMDVLTHAVEAYTGRKATPITDALALHAIRLVAQHLESAVADGHDRRARAGMMMASLIAGMAFGNSDVAAVHCLAEALGGRYDTPHGVANAVFLPVVFGYNAQADPVRHAEVATLLGVSRDGRSVLEVAQLGAEALANLASRVGIPRLRDLPNVDPADFPSIAQASAANGSTPSNARPIDAAGYEMLLDEAFGMTSLQPTASS